MAQYVNVIPQTLTAGQALPLLNNSIKGCCNIRHREGSPLITLIGSGCCKSPNLYRISAHLVVAGATTPITLALAVDGVVIPETTIALPAVAADTPVSGSTEYIVAVDGCSSKVSVVAITAATVNSAVVTASKV